jgi:hypothetical protein
VRFCTVYIPDESIVLANAIGADKLLNKVELDEKLVTTILALANAAS